MSYSAEELISIIKTCSKAGISTLKVGEMELKFAQSSSVLPQETVEIPHNSVQNPSEIDPEDEILLKEQRQMEMLLSNPEGYEELLAKEGLAHVD